MKERFAKLIDVKSIVTIILTGVFSYLSVTGSVTADQFLTIFTVVISFYFGTQVGKKEAENNESSICDAEEKIDLCENDTNESIPECEDYEDIDLFDGNITLCNELEKENKDEVIKF